MKTIKDYWETHQGQPVNNYLSPTEVKVARNAFYSGFLAMLTVASELGEDESLSEEEGVEVIDGLFKEIGEYFTELNAALEN